MLIWELSVHHSLGAIRSVGDELEYCVHSIVLVSTSTCCDVMVNKLWDLVSTLSMTLL
jgi:hypothetical protein